MGGVARLCSFPALGSWAAAGLGDEASLPARERCEGRARPNLHAGIHWVPLASRGPPAQSNGTPLSAPGRRGEEGEARRPAPCGSRWSPRAQGWRGSVKRPLLGFDTAAGPQAGPGPTDCLGAYLPLDLPPLVIQSLPETPASEDK